MSSVLPLGNLAVASATPNDFASERRHAQRIQVEGDVWLADRSRKIITKGIIQNASHSGAQIRIPIGFGLNVGQAYELRSYAPGASASAFGLHPSRWARVVRTQVVLAGKDAVLNVALRFLT